MDRGISLCLVMINLFCAPLRKVGILPKVGERLDEIMVHMKESKFNSHVRRRLEPTLLAYKPPWWLLDNGHLETAFCYMLRINPTIKYHRQLLVMPNKATVTLDWEDSATTQ